MKAEMTLSDALRDLDQFSNNDTNTIYAKRPWSHASPAFVAEQPPDGRLPEAASAAGFSYFVEVFIAQDFLRDWSGSFEAFCDRIIYYLSLIHISEPTRLLSISYAV